MFVVHGLISFNSDPDSVGKKKKKEMKINYQIPTNKRSFNGLHAKMASSSIKCPISKGKHETIINTSSRESKISENHNHLALFSSIDRFDIINNLIIMKVRVLITNDAF